MTRAYNRELVHGTVQGYLYRKCRCEDCLQARRDYYGHKPRAVYLAEVEPPHGTEGRYTSRKWRCRCDACRTAANAYRRTRRKEGTVNTHNYAGYCNGCRCQICTEAIRVYRKNLAAKEKETP